MNKLKIKNLEFHIKSDDTFATFATVISLARQFNNVGKDETLKNIEDNLMYLQKNYKIVKK